ncbi:hypothetical protein C8R45DRAFT_923132 [Mycena sanguinolenta]|nr:hypothetical protein C8R45DRAFT_923132 [Mycena sanguinolenta]
MIGLSIHVPVSAPYQQEVRTRRGLHTSMFSPFFWGLVPIRAGRQCERRLRASGTHLTARTILSIWTPPGHQCGAQPATPLRTRVDCKKKARTSRVLENRGLDDTTDLRRHSLQDTDTCRDLAHSRMRSSQRDVKGKSRESSPLSTCFRNTHTLSLGTKPTWAFSTSRSGRELWLFACFDTRVQVNLMSVEAKPGREPVSLFGYLSNSAESSVASELCFRSLL